MMNEMTNANTHIEGEAQCIEGNLNQLTNQSSDSLIQIWLIYLQNAESENTIFQGKQKSTRTSGPCKRKSGEVLQGN